MQWRNSNFSFDPILPFRHHDLKPCPLPVLTRLTNSYAGNIEDFAGECQTRIRCSPRVHFTRVSAHPGPKEVSHQPVPAAVQYEAIRQLLRGLILDDSSEDGAGRRGVHQRSIPGTASRYSIMEASLGRM